MKRYLGALLAAGMVFALVLGSAAALDVNNTAPLQVGFAEDLTCDDEVDIQVGFGEHQAGPTDLEDTQGTRGSYRIIVSDISNECDGAWVTAIALDDDGNELAFGQQQIADDAGSTEEVIAWDEGVDPLHVTRVELHLS